MELNGDLWHHKYVNRSPGEDAINAQEQANQMLVSDAENAQLHEDSLGPTNETQRGDAEDAQELSTSHESTNRTLMLNANIAQQHDQSHEYQ